MSYKELEDGRVEWGPVEMEITHDRFLQLYCAALTGLCSGIRRLKHMTEEANGLEYISLDEVDADELAEKAYLVADRARQVLEFHIEDED